MELLDVELRPKPFLRFSAGTGPGGVADLVAAGLADLGTVALDFALRARARETGRFHQVIGRLIAAPALGVEAGVNYQPRGAEQEGLEETGPPEWAIAVGADLVGELLGVQRPAFRIGREEAEFPQCRDVLRFLRDADPGTPSW